ncbi:MAG TPA: non-ribosomal peptide synthetase [Steroidobacteraceae bacterium]|nr:non-ribosomal peptide synthetase [Steroidobacteraceae bacterium]
MSVSFAWESPAGSVSASCEPQGQTRQPTSIADLLLRAAQHSHAGLCFVRAEGDAASEFVSYPALLQEARCILGGLRRHPRPPGAKIALLLEHARDFIPAFWACVLGGYVPCPLTPIRNDPVRWAKHLAHVEQLLEQPLLVSSRALSNELPDLNAIDLDMLRAAPAAAAFHEAPIEDPAVLMLTSGSTGNSKAVVLTHGHLLASMSGKAQRQAMSAADIAFNWISFDHVAALAEVHLISLYVGATQVHADPAAILKDPLLFLRLIDQHRVTVTFSPNFLLGQIDAMLSASGVAGAVTARPLDLSSLRHIISGGEANVVETGRRFLQLLAPYGLAPSVLRPAFGMTETCGGSIYSGEFPDCDGQQEFASVGYPVHGLEMRIIDERGAIIPAGVAGSAEVGELQLRGSMIFNAYYRNEEATRAAFTVDGWFRTGDLGRIDDGRLTLVGRSKDSIIVSGVNYFSHELEAVLESLPGIERSFIAVFPTRPKGADTEQLVVTFATCIPLHVGVGHEPIVEDEEQLHQLAVAIRNTTILLWGFRPALILPLPKEAFPKTSLGKIQRSLLRKRLEAGELNAHLTYFAAVTRRQFGELQPLNGPAEVAVAAVFAHVLGLDCKDLGANANFFDLGGTSLDIFGLKLGVEQRFALSDVPVVTLLQNPTVRALAARLAAGNRTGNAHYDPLVALQVTGNKTPLFCIHPGTGEVLVFVSIANYFINDRPFYALRTRGFNNGEEPFASLEEMVATYVQAIRRQQPHGPYALAGYSFGAPVAFEIAKVLEAQGERVAFVGSIDGTPFIGDPAGRLDFVGSTVVVSFFLGLLDKQQMAELPQLIRASGEDPCAYILHLAPAERFAALNLDLTKFQAWAALAYSLVVIGEAYVPSGVVDSVTVFYAEPLRGAKPEWLDQHLRRWDEFTRAANRYVEAPGEHHSLLGPKHVAGFQALLRAEIDHALQGQ